MVVVFNPIKRGGLRRLTLGEVYLATTVYGFSIRYNEVWIHRESYLPFNLQAENYAMTPNGELYFQEGTYQDDISMALIDSQHLFLHEMMHVYQHQRGMWVRTRGAFSWAVDYQYTLDKDKLSDYPMEQQACIVSDNWLLIHYGFYGYNNLYRLKDYNPSEPVRELMAKYQRILRGFPS